MSNAEENRTILFLRHGQTVANVQMIASGGERNPGLTPFGREQTKQAVETLRLHSLIPGLIITSPLTRAFSTAKIVADSFDLDIKIEPNLAERMLGDWNDLTSDIVNPMIKSGKTPPNGESKPVFKKRTIEGLRSCCAYLDQMPLIVSSRGTARVLLEMINDDNAHLFPNGKLLRILLADSDEFEVLDIERLS